MKLTLTSCTDEHPGDVLKDLNGLSSPEEEDPRLQHFSFAYLFSASGQSWLAQEYFYLHFIDSQCADSPVGGSL